MFLGVFGCSLMVLGVPLVFCVQHRFWVFLDGNGCSLQLGFFVELILSVAGSFW